MKGWDLGNQEKKWRGNSCSNFFSIKILSENQDALMVGGNINQSVAI